MEEEALKEFGMEFAIENISQILSSKMQEYEKTKDDKLKKEIAELLIDREKIYSNDINTIKKYLKEGKK